MTTHHQTSTYGEMLGRALERYGNRPALIQQDEVVTYAELRDRVSQMAAALQAAGLRPGDGVAFLAPNLVDTIVLLIATQTIGVRYTPLHPLGGEEDHVYLLEDAEVRCVVVDPVAYGHRLAVFAERNPSVRRFTFGPHELAEDLVALAAATEPGPLQRLVSPDELVAVLYTGGTTGRPKGVMHSQRAFVSATITALASYQWDPEPRAIVCTPLSHAAGPVLLAPVLHNGGFLVLHQRFDPERFLDDVQRYRANCSWLVPTMIYALLDLPGGRAYDTSSLRTLIHGGGPIAPERLQEALGRFGPVFQHAYGQVETMIVCSLPATGYDPDRPETYQSCGAPLIGVEIAILDPAGNRLPPREIGEVCVRSAGVMEGYWKLPEETAKVLRDGWRWTADVGYLDESGLLYLVDRKSDFIVSGGFNVYPRLVEDALMAHPAVELAAVIGVPDERWHEAVAAFVKVRAGESVTDAELIAFVKQRRGSLSAPKRVDFLDDIPLTPIGKVDRKALRDPFWADSARQI